VGNVTLRERRLDLLSYTRILATEGLQLNTLRGAVLVTMRGS
jgi:hypothetical protein